VIPRTQEVLAGVIDIPGQVAQLLFIRVHHERLLVPHLRSRHYRRDSATSRRQT
jgi:hypothetical protein